MTKQDKKLNSLSRYEKRSPRFVLEEHGHCEVPAGCGGAVLRWVDARRAEPLHLRLLATGDASLTIDGVAPESSRPLVEYGDHVIGVRLARSGSRPLVVMFACVRDAWKVGGGEYEGGERPAFFVTTDDDTWRCTTDEPGDDSWMLPGFDDAHWRAMVPRDLVEAGGEDMRDDYRVESLLGLGAHGVGAPEEADRVWVRRAFTLPRP